MDPLMLVNSHYGGNFGHSSDFKGIFITMVSGFYESQQALKDPLHAPVRPITGARSKKCKEALNGSRFVTYTFSLCFFYNNWVRVSIKI